MGYRSPNQTDKIDSKGIADEEFEIYYNVLWTCSDWMPIRSSDF